MRTIAILLLLSTPAAAQLQGAGSCSRGNMTLVPAEKAYCEAQGGTYYGPPSNFYPLITGNPTFSGVVTGSNWSAPSMAACPKGRELVMRSNGGYGCAADVEAVR